MKKYILIAAALTLSLLSCSEKDQNPKDQKSAEQLSYEEIEAAAVKCECTVTSNFLELITVSGSKEKNKYRILFKSKQSGTSVAVLLPASPLPPDERDIAPGYYAIEKKFSGITDVAYRRGVLLVTAKNSGEPRYSFAFETEAETAVFYGTPEEDSFSAQAEANDLIYSFGSSSTVKATYYSAGSVGGKDDYDCLKLKLSNSVAGFRAEGTIILLINEVFNNQEMASLVGEYSVDIKSGNHVWFYSSEETLIHWYNSWNEQVAYDGLYGNDLTVSRSGGYLHIKGKGATFTSAFFAILGGKTTYVNIDISIKESDIEMV